MKNLRSILGIILALVAFIANAQTTTNDWSKRIKSKTIHPLASFISPHVSPIQVLIIDGKRFEHVRGMNFFYLQVPNTNSIVFVTEDINYKPTYHIFNMDTDGDMAIQPQSFMLSFFGKSIGSPCSYTSDTVTVGDDGIIVLSHLDKDIKSTLPELANVNSIKDLIYLDLNKKAIIAGKTLHCDKAGKIIYERDAAPPF